MVLFPPVSRPLGGYPPRELEVLLGVHVQELDRVHLKPFVTTRTIDLLASTARERGIAYCRVGGEIRSPSAFRSEFYADLMALRGDAGAKELIRRNMDRAVGLEVDPVELLDVDTEEDLELARRIASERAVNRRK